ncbi:protein of unknown function [Flagellimonas taeanensis]|jgi:hypothetical protein|uniref:DUF4202 domain-containing protein n=1 Tax=Flagellimonas taeanensis TaxID=1005926 RepID=A0A1M6WD67_9FLAO|nr:DUF4202 domain-containing protein [Allomuricauda taeanensis]SFC44220.1 protein of unknown function [Allomuricauda taeanensis]SHK91730.1 protein of unknown function [Allomuricauda taeanensis]
MGESKKLLEAFKLFDAANAQDPNTEVVEGKEYAKELLYAQRMTDTLSRFEPNASEALQLTARCQHICRWEIPRESYEMNRVGYLKWRQDLKKFHAEKASTLLKEVGYDEKTIERVHFLLLKKQLKKDEETQTLEDVICLVFLQYYYEPFLVKHDDAKMISILQKTWKKMSPKGQDSALQLTFSKKGAALLSKAMAS